jgi:hypothetical protein
MTASLPVPTFFPETPNIMQRVYTTMIAAGGGLAKFFNSVISSFLSYCTALIAAL